MVVTEDMVEAAMDLVGPTEVTVVTVAAAMG